MQLTMWTYEGPPHVGAMRVATGMRDLHYVLHAPQGDTYADLLFTMIERRKGRPPVTYTTFQARDLGSDTAEIFKTACKEAVDRFDPQAIIVGASCTAELIQDDPGGLAKTLGLSIPVIPRELPSYQKKENWGAAETFYQIVRKFTGGHDKNMHHTGAVGEVEKPQNNSKTCNILGATALGFRHRDDVTEVTKLLSKLGVKVNVAAPLDATPADIAKLPDADFNVVLYPEIAGVAAEWLKRNFKQPMTKTVPIGLGATADFVREVALLADVDPAPALDFDVCGLGTYSREYARDVRKLASEFNLEALITDDHLQVEDALINTQPELVLGTQMERHVAKRLRLPCAVISSPVHVQDFPARYSPQMGVEGSNVIFDSWVHPLMMGLEEHLLGMFREDFEFNDEAQASHLTAHSVTHEASASYNLQATTQSDVTWTQDAEKELKKIPFFVRGKARRNTEAFALEQGFNSITVDTLYDAKAHFSR